MGAQFNKKPIIGTAVVVALVGGLLWARSNGMLGSKTAPSEVAISAEAPERDGPTVVAGASSYVPNRNASVRFCGSNTIGSELAPALVEDYLASKGAQNVRREKTADVVNVSGVMAGESFTVEIRSAGTGTAFKDMAASHCDIAMASREILPDERSLLGEGVIENVIGLDGIAVVVNQANPVDKLSLPQLTALFTGGGWPSGGPVEVVSYDEKSGTYDTFKKLVLGGSALTPAAKRFSSSADILRALASSTGAISYVSLSAARGAKVLAISDQDTLPVVPTTWTVVRENYPLTRRLFLYAHKTFTRVAAEPLVSYALSDAGQAVVARTGFVDLSVKAEAAGACPTCPAPYVRATAGAQRLSVDFRFLNGSSALDSRATKDAERVAAFAKAYRITLLGFADNSGAAEVNQRLSLARAETVKGELARHGLSNVVTAGMGSLMPTASNVTEEGRQKNRRVEVWIQ